jgi:hypothetical protein
MIGDEGEPVLTGPSECVKRAAVVLQIPTAGSIPVGYMGRAGGSDLRGPLFIGP